MTEIAPIPLLPAEPPPRDRRILATVAASVVLHLLVLGLVLLPRAPQPEPTPPQSIAVDLVPASAVSSLSSPPSSEEPSSTAPSAVSSEPPSASASEPPSSPVASSSAMASSAELPSSAPSAASASAPPPSDSSAEPPSGPSSARASSAEAASSAASAASAPSVPPARPVVIPVGQGASSEQAASADAPSATASEAASAASSAEAASASAASDPVLTASGAGASDGVAEGASSGVSSAEVARLADGPPPPARDLLHAAKRFYLSDLLDQTALAKARAALKQLPPEKRLAQTCNIEAVGQIGNAGQGLSPDAMVANAFAAPAVSGATYNVSNGAFRSGRKWYAMAYECTLSKDMTEVTAFRFHIGGDVTEAMVARYGKG